jgi:hypothetical protein
MGTLVRFPKLRRRARRQVSSGGRGESAVVVILPVIRIEREPVPVPRGRRPRASHS